MNTHQRVGMLPKRVSTTKMTNQPWSGRQSYNVFAQEQENDSAQQPSRPAHHRQSLAKPSAVGGLLVTPSAEELRQQRPAVADRPRSGSIIAPSQEEAPRQRSSSRVLNRPGGQSSMGSILSQQQEQEQQQQRRPSTRKPVPSINIFSGASSDAQRSSTKRINAPGGQSEMDKVMAHQCGPQGPQGFRTGRMNQSRNVLNLTPAPVKRSSARTAKINEESHEDEHKVCASRYAARTEALRSNDIFTFADEDEEEQPQQQQQQQQQQQAEPQRDTTLHGTGRPSTKLHYAPGGKSSGNIIGGW